MMSTEDAPCMNKLEDISEPEVHMICYVNEPSLSEEPMKDLEHYTTLNRAAGPRKTPRGMASRLEVPIGSARAPTLQELEKAFSDLEYLREQHLAESRLSRRSQRGTPRMPPSSFPLRAKAANQSEKDPKLISIELLPPAVTTERLLEFSEEKRSLSTTQRESTLHTTLASPLCQSLSRFDPSTTSPQKQQRSPSIGAGRRRTSDDEGGESSSASVLKKRAATMVSADPTTPPRVIKEPSTAAAHTPKEPRTPSPAVSRRMSKSAVESTASSPLKGIAVPISQIGTHIKTSAAVWRSEDLAENDITPVSALKLSPMLRSHCAQPVSARSPGSKAGRSLPPTAAEVSTSSKHDTASCEEFHSTTNRLPLRFGGRVNRECSSVPSQEEPLRARGPKVEPLRVTKAPSTAAVEGSAMRSQHETPPPSARHRPGVRGRGEVSALSPPASTPAHRAPATARGERKVKPVALSARVSVPQSARKPRPETRADAGKPVSAAARGGVSSGYATLAQDRARDLNRRAVEPSKSAMHVKTAGKHSALCSSRPSQRAVGGGEGRGTRAAGAEAFHPSEIKSSRKPCAESKTARYVDPAPAASHEKSSNSPGEEGTLLFCVECGKRYVSAEAKFCGYCGQRRP